MLRSQIQWSGLELVPNWTARTTFPSLPFSEDGAGSLQLSLQKGRLSSHTQPRLSWALPSTARHKMQMCGTAMQRGSQRAPDSPPNFLTPSHSRGWETEGTHLKGPACRSSIGDIAALPIKSITPAALAQAYCYFSHIRSLRLSCKSGLM